MFRKIFLVIFLFNLLFGFNIFSVMSYDFKTESGITETAQPAGYNTEEETGASALSEKIGKIIETILSFLGVIFLLLMIYGGYTWMTARGNEQEVEKAKSLIRNALIGLIIVLAAYAITAFVGGKLKILK